ncbi:hypothetical protein [Azospirillum argentinense]
MREGGGANLRGGAHSTERCCKDSRRVSRKRLSDRFRRSPQQAGSGSRARRRFAFENHYQLS